jgi:hypothetical protein
MTLIHDDIDDVWVWVMDSNYDDELSPEFDTQEYALRWRGRISQELQSDLDKLYGGDSVVIPKNKEHAEAMVRMGMFYLETQYGKRDDTAQ